MKDIKNHKNSQQEPIVRKDGEKLSESFTRVAVSESFTVEVSVLLLLIT